MRCAPSVAPFGRLVWVPETEGKMLFIQGAGLSRAQVEKARPARVGWWQVALRGLFTRSRNA